MGQFLFFLKFSWKLSCNLILIWQMQKSNLFSQFFSSSFSFCLKIFNFEVSFYTFNFYLLINMTCFYTIFQKTIHFWYWSAEISSSIAFCSVSAIPWSDHKFFYWFSWALLISIALHFYQNKCLNYQTLQVECFKFCVMLQKIVLLWNKYKRNEYFLIFATIKLFNFQIFSFQHLTFECFKSAHCYK